MSREDYRKKTTEELRKLSDNYDFDPFSARDANHELDRREDRELQERRFRSQFWFNLTCGFATTMIGIATVLIGLPTALPYIQSSVEAIIKLLTR